MPTGGFALLIFASLLPSRHFVADWRTLLTTGAAGAGAPSDDGDVVNVTKAPAALPVALVTTTRA